MELKVVRSKASEIEADAVVVLVPEGPPPPEFDPQNPFRYFVRSPSFLRRFPNVTECALFPEIKRYCRNSRGGSLGESEVVLADANGSRHVFIFHTFFNTYDALTLGRYLRPHAAFLGQASSLRL